MICELVMALELLTVVELILVSFVLIKAAVPAMLPPPAMLTVPQVGLLLVVVLAGLAPKTLLLVLVYQSLPPGSKQGESH